MVSMRMETAPAASSSTQPRTDLVLGGSHLPMMPTAQGDAALGVGVSEVVSLDAIRRAADRAAPASQLEGASAERRRPAT